MADLFDSDENDSNFDPENDDKGDVNIESDGENDTNKRALDGGIDDSADETAKPKKKARNFIEDQADEGSDDEDGDGGDDRDDDEDEDEDEDVQGDEDRNDYVADGFVVLDEDEMSDDGATRVKKKRNFQRIKHAKHVMAAEDDDLELIRDNMANERRYDEIAPELVREKDDENAEDGTASDKQGVAVKDEDAGASDGRRGLYSSRYHDDYDSDDLSDFVVDDEDANEEGLHEEEDPEERRRRRKERAERMNNMRMLGGPDREQLEEASAMFGEGYEDLLGEASDDEDEEDVFGDRAAAKEAEKASKLRKRTERKEIIESFCTDHDDIIRSTDRPERMIDVMVGRHPPGEEERGEEAIWIADLLATRIIAEERTTGQKGDESALAAELRAPVLAVLELLQDEDSREVPFIWAYRKDYLHDVMTRSDLWLIHSLDEKWESIVDKRQRMLLDLDFISEATEEGAGRLHSQQQLTREEREQLVAEKQAEYDECRMELDAAHEALAASNIIDEEEEDGADFGLQQKDSELVSRAERRLQEAKDQMEVATHELELEQKLLTDLIRSLRSSRASCKPDVANKFLELFPAQRYKSILINLRDEIEVRDMAHFFSLLYRGSIEECSGGLSAVARAAADGGRMKIRKGLDKEAYFAARRHPELREIVDMFSVSAACLGDAVRYGASLKVQPPAPPIDVESLPSSYLSSDCPTIEIVMERARVMIAAEIAAEPSVRRVVRAVYRSVGYITTQPTAAGLDQINPFHELFGLHMLDRRPLREFFESKGSGRYMYARLMQAKSQGLIEVKIMIPTLDGPNGIKADLAPFFDKTDIMKLYLADKDDSWNEQRLLVLATAMEKYLLPHMKEECHRELMRLSNEALIEESTANFRDMLSVGPFRPSNVQRADILRALPRRPVYPSVATVWLSNQSREPMYLAFTDKDGVLRAYDQLPGGAKNQKRTKLKEFFKMTRPDVIAVNTSAGQISQSTKLMIENYLKKEVRDSLIEELSERRRAREDLEDYNRYQDDEDEITFDPDVLLVKDDVARIFGSSSRAKKLLRDLQPGAAAAVCLCRFVQDPINEYASMWTSANELGDFGHESWYLDFHPHKSLLTKSKAPLIRALENCLVDAVCEAGVDINMAAAHDHLASPLAFVGGLGLRKAANLISQIKTKLHFVTSRKELFERKLLKSCVYNNAAGFLRICDNGSDEHVLDPFDDSRIHPECYVQNDFAPKIVASALEVPHNAERYMKNLALLTQHVKRELDKALRTNCKFNEAWMRGELIPLEDKLDALNLEDFSSDLEKAGKGRRFKQFEDIQQELRFPWYDRRKPLTEPSMKELFTLITGETDQSLYAGMKVGCKVLEARGGGATVIIENGMRGNVHISRIVDPPNRVDDIKEILRPGDMVTGVVIAVHKDRFRVEVSLKPSDTEQSEDHWLSNRNVIDFMREWWQQSERKEFDRYFNEAKALAAYSDNLKSRLRFAEQSVRKTLESSVSAEGPGGVSEQPRHVRQVFHTLFKNFNSKEAEIYLDGMGAGEMVLRPSSKGPDCLVITWAFQEGVYKHIEVTEVRNSDKRNDHGLSDILLIKGETEPYSDIDEIFARYIEPMNDLVSQMIGYRCFRQGSKEEVDAWLQDEIANNPTRIPYCIRFYHKQPGYFVLSWLLKKGSAIKNEIIAVKPEGYKMRDQLFRTPSELIHWFKTKATAKPKPAAPPPSRIRAPPPPPPSQHNRPPPPAAHAPPPAPQRTKPSRFSQAHPMNQQAAGGYQ